jgi:hypothetical protein
LDRSKRRGSDPNRSGSVVDWNRTMLLRSVDGTHGVLWWHLGWTLGSIGAWMEVG